MISDQTSNFGSLTREMMSFNEIKIVCCPSIFQLKQLLELIEGEILPLIPSHSHFFFSSVHSAINVVCQMKLATQIFLLIVRKIATVAPVINSYFAFIITIIQDLQVDSRVRRRFDDLWLILITLPHIRCCDH